MADLLNTLKELRPEIIDLVFKEITSDLSDVEFKILPYKEVNRNYMEIGIFTHYSKPMTACLPDAPYPVDNYYFNGVIQTVTGFHFKEGIPLYVKEIQELHQMDSQYRKYFLIDKLDWLKERAVIRMKQVTWDALRGTININENNVNYVYNYSITEGSVNVDWSNPNNNILADLETILSYYDQYPAKPKYLVMNSTTYRYFRINNNIATLLATAGFLVRDAGINQIINDFGVDILKIDDYWIDPSGTKHKFINDNEVFIIGEGKAPLGHIVSLVDENTTTLDKPGKPGFWTQIIDKTNENPRRYDIVAGITFFPAIYHPEWIVHIADVTQP